MTTSPWTVSPAPHSYYYRRGASLFDRQFKVVDKTATLLMCWIQCGRYPVNSRMRGQFLATVLPRKAHIGDCFSLTSKSVYLGRNNNNKLDDIIIVN